MVTTNDLAGSISDCIVTSLEKLRESKGVKAVATGVIEVHPCYGFAQVHLKDGPSDNIEIETMTYPTIGSFNFENWAEEYGCDGFLTIDGVKIGGNGDEEVERFVLEKLIKKVKPFLDTNLPINITTWVLSVGYSNSAQL